MWGLSTGAGVDNKGGQGFQIGGRDDKGLLDVEHTSDGNDELDLPAAHAQAGQKVAEGRQLCKIAPTDRGDDDGFDARHGALDGGHSFAPG